MKVPAFLLLLASTSPNVTAFSLPSLSMRSPTPLLASTAPDFYEAVQTAASSNTVMDLGELDRLATELENIEGCTFEDGEELCDKEIQDRLDVAGVLRLKIELRLR